LEHGRANGLRTSAGRNLPALATVLLMAGLAAWLWPVDVRTSAAVPARSAVSPRESVALPLAVEATRSPLERPLPARVTPRAEAHAPGLAVLPDERGNAGEREHLARLLALAARDPSALEAEAARLLEGSGPDCEKVALLRALEAGDSPRRIAWLEHAVVALPDTSDSSGESVPSFALGRLLRAGAQDPAARAALERIAFGHPRASDRLRRVAASSLAASADELGLRRLAANLADEPDGLLRDSVLEALSRNCSPSAVAAVFGRVHDGHRPELAEADQE
jgi:hypothetical protein